MDTTEVVAVGQVDARVCGREERQVDVMVTGTTATYTHELLELGARIREVVRPILLQLVPSKKKTHSKPPSLAFVVSQSRVVWGAMVGGVRVGLVGEVRECEGEGGASRGKLTLSGLKMWQQPGGSADDIVFLSLPHLVLVRKESDLRLSIGQRVRAAWQPSLHLTLVRAVKDMEEMRTLVTSTTSPITPPSPPTPDPNPKLQSPTTLHIGVNEKLTMSLHTGQHTMKLLLSSITAKVAPSTGVSWMQAPKVRVKLDRVEEGRTRFHEVAALEEIVVSLVPKSEKLSAERRRMEGSTVSENRCFVVAMANLSITQPYQFPLHKVVFGEVMGALKWLKTLHGKPKKDGDDGGLPKDLLINVKSFRLELSDDPFEVKLRDNYELKEDEYLESEKRYKVLNQRIEEMRRKDYRFPQEKIDELSAKMKVKNAEIYVQRAKRFCEPRTRLLEWVVMGLEVMVVADPSLQGKSNVLRHMKDCDREAPWPPDSHLSFSTLWCRWVKLEAASFSVQLRDFPQRLLDVRTLAMWGRLAGAEVTASKRAVRTHTVEAGHPWDPITVQRSLTPLKFYHDLACDVETLSFAYGSCWEPAMTQVFVVCNYVS